ncbi:CCR4-associated factor Not3 isoform X2 [Leptinotarsa decemlineata]|uniref:CCR4-associated factor Not3 isoform X2 n=1 Tax=Leptinotarsa decemlineata TaxID=7539 RepID=UPI003D307852
MAATRKLQGEIDRCLKKVMEGVETFDDIWQKVHNAANNNQKEKYEADLKKEIKKLQRLRDQIKSWIASAEIKDKSILMDNRKLIETQMERFKVVERETKTKAYSKEGLGAAQKLDPAQKEREEIQHWLVLSIEKLNIGTDSFESEIEQLLSNKKKKLDKDKQDRIEELKSKLEKHRFHIRKLETLLRMLDNMSVEVEQIKNIKDDVEYYIESHAEPDFADNEFIYDEITGMDEVELSGVGLPSSATTDSNDTGGTPTSIISGSSPVSSPPLMNNSNFNHSMDTTNETDKKVVGKEQPKYLSGLNFDTQNSELLAHLIHTEFSADVPNSFMSQPVKPTPVRASVSVTSTTSTSSLMNVSGNSALNYSGNSATSTPSKPTLVSSTPSKLPAPFREASPVQQQATTTAPVVPSSNFAAVAASSVAKVTTSGESNPASVISIVSQVQTQNSSNAVTSVHSDPISSFIRLQNSTNPPQKPFVESHVQSNCISPEPTTNAETLSMEVESTQPVANGADEKISEGMTTLKSMAQQVIDQAGLQNNSVILESNKSQSQGMSDAHIPPLLGVAPLGAIPLLKEHQTQFQLMESAFYHMPHLSDSERIRPGWPFEKIERIDVNMGARYLPRTPCPTPAYYIQSPLAHSDSLEFYQRLATETLFFVFYYMEGTKAQYLAAKALKKQSWRFHTKYMMWFQRHEEPKIINEEYEQGTYIYFDYEKWGQRKKEGFTFEYKYLEDRDLN